MTAAIGAHMAAPAAPGREALARRQRALLIALDVAAPLAALVLYLNLALPQLHLPGLYYDEALDVVPAMQLLRGQPLELARDTGFPVLGKPYPVMAMDYVGAVNTYLVLPFFAHFGIGVIGLRAMTVALGALTVLLAWCLARALFGRPVALTSAVLLAVQPSFIFWTRQGVHVTSAMSVFLLGTVLALVAWQRRGWGILLYLAAFLAGLGLSAKVLFVWFLVALVALYLGFQVLGRLVRRPALRWPARYDLPIVLGAFVLGAGMVLWYNLQTLGTIEVIGKNLYTTSYGVNNMAVGQNLQTRLHDLAMLLDGSHFWFLGGTPRNDLAWPISLGGLALALILLPFDAAWRPRWRRVAFVVGLIGLVYLQSAFTVSQLGPTHYFALLPFLPMVLAIGLWLFLRVVYGLPWWPLAPSILPYVLAAPLVVGALVAVGGRDYLVTQEYHRRLRETGGLLAHSDAIYPLAGYLDEARIAQPMALDWGIKTSVQLLTQGRVNPKEIFLYQPEANQFFVDQLYKEMVKLDTVYIFRSDELTVFRRKEAFEELARRLGKQVRLERTFGQPDGKVLYLVYTVR